MRRKIFYTLLIITMVVEMLFTLTGCGNSNQKQNEEEDTNQEITNQAITNQEATEQENQQIEQVEGKSGSVVEYKGYTYYWKLTANSRKQTGLFANYYDIQNVDNELVRVDKNGNEEVILTDKGSGDIFILNDRIFLSYAIDEYGTKRNMYSIDLNGENKCEYNQGKMEYIIGNYIICQNENTKEIFRINTTTNQIESIKQNANLINCIDGIIYYSEDYDMDNKNLKIGSITENSDNGIIATISTSEFKYYIGTIPVEVVQLWKEDDNLNMYVGYSDGTANMLQELLLITMDKDGKNFKEQYVSEISEQLEADNKQLPGGIFLNTVQQNGGYTNELIYIDEQTKERKNILTQSEINEKFNFTEDDEHITTLYTSSINDNDIYVMLDYNEHYPAEDMGWRYSYKRLKTVLFKYNIETKEITTIYEF